MPANVKGGKGYKKKKKESTALYREPIFIDRQVGQMPARALRILGNRNILCYSNDNVLRMCHICGKMKGRNFVEPGDVVLITLRDFSSPAAKANTKSVKLGDIIAKYDPEQFGMLKAEEGVNPKIFMKLETMDGCRVGEVGTDMTTTTLSMPEDDGYDFERSGSEDEGSAAAATTIVNSAAPTRPTEKDADADVNIDDI